jgi:hypothetical protein
MADTDIDKELMTASVSHFMENSTVRTNGTREVPKAAFREALAKHGVDDEMVKKVHDAVAFESTAAGRVALADLEKKIEGATDEDLADENFRRNLSAMVRLPTYGGSTEITAYAETHNPIPSRGTDADGNPNERGTKVTYGRIKTSINTKARIHADLHEESNERMRRSLKVTASEAAD